MPGDEKADQRDKEGKAADDRLNEYLAEKNRHEKALQQKLFDELHSRDLDKERQDAEERLNDDLKLQSEREKDRFQAEIQRVEEQRKDEIVRLNNEQQRIREQRKREAQNEFHLIDNERQISYLNAAEERAHVERQRIIEQSRKEEERKKAEEKERLDRIRADEEIQKADERRRIENERLIKIFSLQNENYLEYLHEAEVFRKEFGKNIQCDVCERWDGNELIHYKNQTYCEKHLPPSYDRTPMRKVIAGRHGASKDYIEK
jgi:hypothetical protein